MKQIFRTVWIMLLAALLLLGGALLLSGKIAALTDSIVSDSAPAVKQGGAVFAKNENAGRVIILDPGHGGEDPGAIGSDGIYEKDLNLQLSLRIRDLLIFEGFQVVMTRSDDRLLYDPSVQTAHKVQDLKTRLDFSTRYPDAVFVSIHMNKFPDEKCRGLQVYYSGNTPQGKEIADQIQGTFNEKLLPSSNRTSKKATSAIYILNRIQIPAILVECGFISCPAENELLQTPIYQQKLAALIVFSPEAAYESKK